MLLIFAAVIFIYVVQESLKNINAPSIHRVLKKRNEQIV
ncbi:MAG: hypothetical protein ACI9LN_001929, partial [Saprospiraceae bacterium]